MQTGIELIAEERKRQIEVEGWTAEHDKCQSDGELAMAAVCYASPYLPFYQDVLQDGVLYSDCWPEWWDKEWDKRRRDAANRIIPNIKIGASARIRNLVKAGALIAAEIDRLKQPSAREASHD